MPTIVAAPANDPPAAGQSDPAAGPEPEPPSADMTSVVSVTSDAAALNVADSFNAGDVAWIHGRLAEALNVLAQVTPAARFESVRIRIVRDTVMIDLHDRHSGLATTTDVLTFPEASSPHPIDVDIAICVDEAMRQIRAGRVHPVREELLLYSLHGVLHCAGHDDQDDASYARMHAEEDRILDAIGVTARFAEDAS